MARRRALTEAPADFFAAAEAPPPPAHAGHRERLRARFREGGATALPDYELLELVLFNAIPRRDTKPLAKALVEAFGDFGHAVSAPRERLMAVEGVTEQVVHQFRLIEAAAQRLAKARIVRKNAISSWEALLDYCRTTMAHREIEEFRILFLDRKNVLIADEPQAKGTVDHVPVYVREVVKRSLELQASALILVHNHPSGDPTPSPADVDMTRRIKAGLATVGVTLHDHLVIGKSREASFVSLGLL